MITSIQEGAFDRQIEASDWRFSAAIVGLCKYLSFLGVDFNLTEEVLQYNSADITEEGYLKFVTHYYGTELHHIKAEQLLMAGELSEEQIKHLNDLLKGNRIMKKTFGKQKYDGTNQAELLQIIRDNRSLLTRETFRYKANMYRNYANPVKLFREGGNCCRLLGYDIDLNRKGKAAAYNFNMDTFIAQDDPVFDFIPFAFYGDREAFFVNDNASLVHLKRTNQLLGRVIQDRIKEEETGKSVDVRRALFETIREMADEYIDYDVEVIVKNKDDVFFQTMYIRKESIGILRKMENYKGVCFSLKVNDHYYINVQQKVTECILNLIRTDELIEALLKRGTNGYLVRMLIGINLQICGGGETMRTAMKAAYVCAKKVEKNIPENKVDSYRQKLISSVVLKDYDRTCQILLQLSNYADVSFGFVYDLFEGFENNKDVVYTFINALGKENGREEL